MAPPPSPIRRPRRWRWFKRIALGLLGLLGTVTLSTWVYLSRDAAKGREDLAAALAETDQLDPRWRWEQLQEDRPSIPDAENSVRVLQAMADSLQGPNAKPITRSPGEEVLRGPANRRLDDEGRAIIRTGLAARQLALARVVSLKDFPRGRAPLTLAPNVLDTLVPHSDHCRTATHLLELYIEQLLHDGRAEEVPGRILAILNTERCLRGDPFFVLQLLRVALRALAVWRTERLLGMGEVADADLQRLIRAFDLERREDLLLAGVRGERAALHRMFENIKKGDPTLADFMAKGAGNSASQPDLWLRLGCVLYSYRLDEDHAYLLRSLNRQQQIAGLPSHEQLDAWDAFQSDFRAAKVEGSWTKRRIIGALLVPIGPKIGEAHLRDQTHLDCCVAALACERFRLQHERWPDKLDDLVPAYLSAVPLDPYVGEPLRYGRRDDGVVISSVGRNRQDDGGHDLRQGWNITIKADIGMPLWDPEARGLPALPPDHNLKP